MRLHYNESGNLEAPLMVFLHGGGVGGWMWDKQVEYFNHYHCLVPDLPGHGASSGIPFSVHHCAEEILALINARAHGKPVIVIGFSLGAQVTIQMLSLNSELIDYAIVNSALTNPIPFANKMIRPTVKWTHWLTRSRYFAKLQAKQLFIGIDMFEKYYEQSCAMSAQTLIDILEENMSFEIPRELSQSKCKVLVTVGARERRVMRTSATDIVTCLPHGEGVLIRNVGHGLSLSHPELFNEMVEAWINDRELPDSMIPIKRS